MMQHAIDMSHFTMENAIIKQLKALTTILPVLLQEQN
jgi:hypothetical protein